MSKTAKRPYVVGNWKMHGLLSSLPAILDIDRAAACYIGVDVALALPFTLINPAAITVEHTAIGGQNCHAAHEGAFTGDISGRMLADCGAHFVLLGHSERRLGCGEDSATVRAKMQATLDDGLSAILCVGESTEQRAAGLAETSVQEQLLASLPDGLTSIGSITIAYEPIWAIGTGRIPQPAEIAAMHGALRQTLRDRLGPQAAAIRLLYGGSVNDDNAEALLAIPDVDGLLVGNASLDPRRFRAVVRAAQQASLQAS
ncbi:triose-phosphate isomerase [Novosphingobium rosa]|uniref:triose-phosphate isomerase n=1 Tax=Novosphingobium rosa TaxID=76978 RepID=UPI0008300E02|nr:triose-phosphate isomerase [Novosphingobium rosa]